MKNSLLLLLLLSFGFSLLAQRLSPVPDSMLSLIDTYQKLPQKHIFQPIDKDEAGTPLWLMVEVFARDCDCPFTDTEVFMTQTSDAGVYDLSIAGDWASARLKGTIQTDHKGRYLIKSILPGTYPNSNTANPHIHVMIAASDPPYYDIVFKPYLNWFGKRDLLKKPEQHFAADLWQNPNDQLIGYVRIYIRH